MGDAAALDDLPQAGGDDIVLHLHAQTLGKGVDSPKPLPHTGEQLNRRSAAVEEGPVQLDALGGTLLNHGVHIGQQAIHAVAPAKAVGLGPKLRWGVAQRRDKGIVLHVRGAQGLIKIVEKGDNGRLLVHKLLLYDKKRLFKLKSRFSQSLLL